MKKFDVVCIGAMVVDLPLGPVDENIFQGETTIVEDIQLTTGGDALNEAIILSRLGNSCALIGHIGKDLLGELIIKKCEEDNVDYSGVMRDEHSSTRINVVLYKQNGERHFIKNLRSDSGSLRDVNINYEMVKNAKAISLASIFSSKLTDKDIIFKILKCASENGVTAFADMVPMTRGETLEFLTESLPYLDYFLPNLEEGKMLTGESTPEGIADCLLRNGVKNIIVKNGKEGCFIKNKNYQFYIPAFNAKAIDSTGAGDNFVAGFITAYLDGKTLYECGKFANAVAAVSTEKVGAVTAVRNRDQIDDRIKNAPRE